MSSHPNKNVADIIIVRIEYYPPDSFSLPKATHGPALTGTCTAAKDLYSNQLQAAKDLPNNALST